MTNLEGESVDDMADALQAGSLIARAGINVDADSGEVAWKSLGGHSNTIFEGSNLVELDWVL